MANKIVKNKNRRKKKAKPKSSSRKRRPESPTVDAAATDGEKSFHEAPSPPTASSPKTKQASSPKSSPSSSSVPTTEALTSMNTQNLFQLSLVCFSISLILFVATFHTIANNGGTAALLGGEVPAAECPVGDALAPSIPETRPTKTKDLLQLEQQHGELLIGYELLHHTLQKESQLKYLHWLREATFRGPKGSLKPLFQTLYQTSQKRLGELESLFEDLEPPILLEDTPFSAMGNSIRDDVESTSQGELVPLPFANKKKNSTATAVVSPKVQWGVRFVLIQAQATRMVVALSTSLLKFEEHPERKEWLTHLAEEYEGIRESLIESLLSTMGEGAWTD